MSLRVRRLVSWTALSLAVGLMLGRACFSVLNGPLPGPAVIVASVLGELVLLGFVVLGLLVAHRQPGNPVGWIIAGAGMAAVATGFAQSYALYALFTDPGSLPGGRTMAWLSTSMAIPVLFAAPALLFLLFPDGHLLGRRWRAAFWLVILTTLSTIAGSYLNPVMNDAPFKGVVNPLSVNVSPAIHETLSNIGWPGMAAGFLVAALAMILRLRRSQGVEKQQLKWIASAAAILPLASTAGIAAYYLGYEKWGGLLVTFSFVPIIFAAGYAILRYRLYDIDLIINRTLVYASLTATLVVVYFGGVATMQFAFRTLTGQEQQPQLAVVVSTLAIAALFNPLRRRIQAFIDRLFYRQRYDAKRTLEAFSTKLRDEIDLDVLGDDLMTVVRETMVPTHVSLWLRPANNTDRTRSRVMGSGGDLSVGER